MARSKHACVERVPFLSVLGAATLCAGKLAPAAFTERRSEPLPLHGWSTSPRQYSASTARRLQDGVAALEGWPTSPRPRSALTTRDLQDGVAVQEGITVVGDNNVVVGDNGVATLSCEAAAELEALAQSPLSAYLQAFGRWLRAAPYQTVIACAALLIGALSAYDGPGFWSHIFELGAMVVAACAARYEAKEWSLDLFSEILLMVQVAFCMWLATRTGFEGFQVLFGAIVGFGWAYSFGDWARKASGVAPSLAFFWYAAGTIFGMVVFTIWQKPVLATAGPLCGSFLLATGVICLSGHFVDVSVLPPPGMPWLDTAAALLEPAGPGALAGHGGCALLAMVLHGGNDERVLPAILCLLGCVAVTFLAAASGFGFGSPLPAESRLWVSVGIFAWGGLAAVSAKFHLKALKENDAVNVPRDLQRSWSNLRATDVKHIISDSSPNWRDEKFPRPGAAADPKGLPPGPVGAGAGNGGLGLAAEDLGPRAFGDRGKYEQVPQEPCAQLGQDWPGRYRILHQDTFVSATVAVPQFQDEIIEYLNCGAIVNVVEVKEKSQRVRARILNPAGWISLVNTENGYRFAEPLGP